MGYDYRKIKPFLEKGEELEDKFALDLVSAHGGVTRKSSLEENRKKHIDLFWNCGVEGKRECSIDVKGARKVKRTDENVSYDETWLELVNGEGGVGSLRGEEDYLVFEGKDEWFMTNRKKLLKATVDAITDSKIYTSRPNDCFKLYQRYGRKDVIVKVPYSFIEENTCQKIPKSI